MSSDFFSDYMHYADLGRSEAPAVYHRWAVAASIGAAMGRKVWMQFGKSRIYPNQYILLMGDPGSRKGTAMGPVKNVLKIAGFNRFSASRTSLQRFLMDMKQYDSMPASGIEDLEQMTLQEPQESFIFAPEFVDFIGQNNMDFINLLTNLWDNLDEYEHPKIQGKSVYVYQPTVSMLGASTAENFALSLPPEAIGSGFLSRVLLIHGAPNGNEIAWPEDDDLIQQEQLGARIKDMRKLNGQIAISPEAYELGKIIYSLYRKHPIEDVRFTHYGTRRFTHLLKLSMILAIADCRMEISKTDMVRGNTMLSKAERRMSKALGEFGASKNSAAANKILTYLATVRKPANVNDIWRQLRRDIAKLPELIEIIQGLHKTGMIAIREILGVKGYMLNHEEQWEWPADCTNLSWLTEQEYIV